MLQIIRWLLVLPAAGIAWFAALFVGVGLYEGVKSLCPADQMISGECFAPWFDSAFYAIVAFGAALAAILIMIGCTWVAPAYKRQVAIATFVVGTIVAATMGIPAGDSIILIPMGTAIVTGAVVLAVLLRRGNLRGSSSAILRP